MSVIINVNTTCISKLVYSKKEDRQLISHLPHFKLFQLTKVFNEVNDVGSCEIWVEIWDLAEVVQI